jgi:hypothetical protein
VEGVREMDGETKVEPLTAVECSGAQVPGLEDYREELAEVGGARVGGS